MNKFYTSLKENFWPITALLFCPCHLPLSMAAFVSLTAGTAIGAYTVANYSKIEIVLAIGFSFYFVLAFMIWVVRGPKAQAGAACAIDQKGNKRLSGLSTKQIVVWGIIGMLMMPALVAISAFTEQDYFVSTVQNIFSLNPAVNSGFIWLVSIATVVMIPVMVIWLVWMWLAWTKTDLSKVDRENWSYEYD